MSSFMPGDLVRRAATGLTSTVSSVASAASGKKRHDSHGTRHSFYEENLISNAKEKYTMTVKCTPNKDAATTADLAIKAGFLMKRNEQGNWQKRFLCIVPHMFLYYYDNEQAEAPRGIIDLELYHDTEREENGGIRLVPADETLRSFHFDDEDDENLNEWATNLIRDRYHMVCEERNAYQQMQSLMTGAIDNASSAQKSSEIEREHLERQLSETESAYLQARGFLQSTLVELGISDVEMQQLTDVSKMGSCLQSRITDIRGVYDRKVEELQDMMNTQQTEYSKMTEEFLKKMENEQLARKNLEALILKERKDSEKRVKEAEAQIDNITLNFQMAVAAKTTSETKANTLNEQKKLLVKEVKQLRKRVEELTQSSEELKSLNDRLLKAATALKLELKTPLAHPSSTVLSGDAADSKDTATSIPDSPTDVVSSESAEGPAASSSELEELLSFTDQLIASSEKFHQQQQLLDSRGKSFDSHGEDNQASKSPPSSSSSNPIHMAMNLFRSTGSESDLQEKNSSDRQASDELSRNNSIADDYYEERPSWEMPPMALRELGWLSEEQNKLMEKRLGEESNHASGVSPAAFKRSAEDSSSLGQEEGRRGSTLGLFSGLLGGTSSSHGSDNTSPHTSGRRSSLMAISSIFKKDKSQSGSLSLSEESNNNTTASSAPAAATKTEDLFFSSPFNPGPEEEDRLPHSMRFHCLRCNGTVEGPKFSTCKCATPALTPEDLTSDRLSSLTGMFKGGILKATGFYGTSSPAQSQSQPGTTTTTHSSSEISL